MRQKASKGEEMRQSFLVIIVKCCSYDSNNSYYAVAGVQCARYDQGQSGNRRMRRPERKQMHERQKCAVEVVQKPLQTNLICFVFLESLLTKRSPGTVSLVRNDLEEVKVCEKCVGGRTTRALQSSCIFSCCRTRLAAHLC